MPSPPPRPSGRHGLLTLLSPLALLTTFYLLYLLLAAYRLRAHLAARGHGGAGHARHAGGGDDAGGEQGGRRDGPVSRQPSRRVAAAARGGPLRCRAEAARWRGQGLRAAGWRGRAADVGAVSLLLHGGGQLPLPLDLHHLLREHGDALAAARVADAYVPGGSNPRL